MDEFTPQALARLKALEPVFGIDPDAPVTSPVNIAETGDGEDAGWHTQRATERGGLTDSAITRGVRPRMMACKAGG
jgi:hypothetical protein